MRTLSILALLLVVAAPLAAQQPPGEQRPDTVVRTPQEQALERLRGIRRVGAPDTVETPDSLRQQPQSVQFPGRSAADMGVLPGDSVVERLLRLTGYVATAYRGDTVYYHADSARLELRGNAQVAREGSIITATERIVVDDRRNLACGYGEPVIQAAQMSNPLRSDMVCFDIEQQRGQASNAETEISEGAVWHMRGNLFFNAQTDNVYSHGAVFTDCDLPWDHKHYYFGAREVKVVRHNVMVARNVTVNFADVPVFWLPFMVQSLSQGRRSGILMPRFGINDIARNSATYSRRIEDVGFYFALNEYMGAEIALDWFAGNWTGLRGSLDYRWNRQFLSGGLTFKQYWKEEGGRDFTLTSNNSWQPDERTRISANGNFVTSTRFIESRTFDPRELNRSIDSNASLNRRFDWGSMTLGANRRQHISNGTVTTQLPSLSLNVLPVTLFDAAPGEERWYSGMTWNGVNLSLRSDRFSVGEETRDLRSQGRADLTSNVSTGLRIGNLSLTQSASFDDRRRHRRDFASDTIPSLPAFHEQRGSWSAGINYMQPLIGTTTLTPGISLGSSFVRNEESGERLVSAPTRIDFNAALRTDLFGFWPGLGPFERLRHRLSPGFTYNYSPEVSADSLQRRLFSGSAGVGERNTLSINLSQTFEAKYRGEEPDSVPTDTTSGPRRRQQVRTIRLLSINSGAVIYDFVAARDGQGFTTTSITNDFQSDLLRGLQFSTTHELFRTLDPALGGGRQFSPHLSNVNASFSLNGDSWLFRMLGLGRATAEQPQGGEPLQQGDPMQAGPATDRTQSEFGLVGTSRRTDTGMPTGPVGSWNANLRYTLVRPREPVPGAESNQMLQGTLSFQPTPNWSVNWSTGYSLTTGEFTDHVLTLNRRLHDWDANFDFLKAQNGNFAFQFRVHLRANPDIKVDYHQSDVPSLRGAQQF